MIDSLISASIKTNDASFLQKFPDMLLTAQDIAAKEWILKYYNKHGVMPTIDRFKSTPHSIYYTEHLTNSPLTDLFSLALENKREGYLFSKWREIESDIEVGSIPTQKIIELGNTLGTFSESTAIKLSNLDRDAIYSNDNKQGILFGFPKIDGDYGGIMPGDCALFTGRPKQFKTLSTNFVAYNVASNYEKVFTDPNAQGKKVLYLSGEMTPTDIVIRMDAIAGKFNSKHLRTDSSKKEEYKQRATRAWSIIHEHGGELIIPNLGVIRTETVLDEINKHQPDLVICDAVYRFESKQEGWRGDAQIIVDICNIARITRTPIIATNQLTRTATPGEISLSDIAYSDSYAREPALILAMYSFEDRPNVSTIKVLASRHSSSVYGDEIEYDFSNSTYTVL